MKSAGERAAIRTEAMAEMTFSSLGPQVSGAVIQVRASDPGPAPEPEHLNLIPDGRDPGPENGCGANHPVSGLPLSSWFEARLTTLGQPRLSEGAQPYLIHRKVGARRRRVRSPRNH